jgi:hypothetical protein
MMEKFETAILWGIPGSKFKGFEISKFWNCEKESLDGRIDDGEELSERCRWSLISEACIVIMEKSLLDDADVLLLHVDIVDVDKVVDEPNELVIEWSLQRSSKRLACYLVVTGIAWSMDGT